MGLVEICVGDGECIGPTVCKPARYEPYDKYVKIGGEHCFDTGGLKRQGQVNDNAILRVILRGTILVVQEERMLASMQGQIVHYSYDRKIQCATMIDPAITGRPTRFTNKTYSVVT